MDRFDERLPMLSAEEIDFLERYGLGPEDVFDARGMGKEDAKKAARRSEKRIIIRTPCNAAGHRLRARSSDTCVQCDPRAIVYSKRHNESGFLYIAYSETGNLLKIGSTQDIEDRERQLRASAYGSLRDWKIVASAQVAKMGAAERHACLPLAAWSVCGTYDRDGREQEASEMFSASIKEVLGAFSIAVNSFGGKRFWKDSALLDRIARR